MAPPWGGAKEQVRAQRQVQVPPSLPFFSLLRLLPLRPPPRFGGANQQMLRPMQKEVQVRPSFPASPRLGANILKDCPAAKSFVGDDLSLGCPAMGCQGKKKGGYREGDNGTWHFLLHFPKHQRVE